MIKYLYSFINQHERYFLFQNVATATANLTLKDYLNITVQIISIITMVLSAAIMADNHFKIFKKTSLKKNAEKESAQVEDKNSATD